MRKLLPNKSTLACWCLLISTGCARGRAADNSRNDESLVPSGTTIVLDDYDSARELPMIAERRVCYGSDERPCQFRYISSVTLRRNGNIILRDASAIQEFDSTGLWVRTIGRTGRGPGEFTIIGGISERPDGGLSVLEIVGFRVVELDSDGKQQKTSDARMPPRANDVRFSRNQLLFVAAEPGDSIGQPVTTEIFALAPGGDSTHLARFKAPAMAVSSSGGLDAGSPFSNSVRWSVGAKNVVGVANSLNYEFAVYVNDNPHVLVRSTPQPQRVTVAQRESVTTEYRRRVASSGASGFAASLQRKLERMPATRPVITSLLVTDDGFIWVQSAVQVPSVDNGPVTSRWDLFNTNGKRIGFVLLPSPARLLSATGARAMFVEEDRAGREYVAMYRLSGMLRK